MKKLNLLLTLSIALLCATQPVKAENSWTSWILPGATATIALLSAYRWHKTNETYSLIEQQVNQEINIEPQRAAARRRDNERRQEKGKADLTMIKNKGLGDHPVYNLAESTNRLGQSISNFSEAIYEAHNRQTHDQLREQKRRLESLKFRSQIATGTFSALTLGLVAYNLK